MRMMRRPAFLILCVIVSNGCNLEDAEPGLQAMQWQGELQPLPGWEGTLGTAGLVTTVGSTRFTAELFIRSDIPGNIRLWRVHESTCASVGPTLGSGDDYPPLTIDAIGEAFASALVLAQLDAQVDYSTRLYASEDEPDVVVACADLVLIGAR